MTMLMSEAEARRVLIAKLEKVKAKDFAAQLGVSSAYISQIKAGEKRLTPRVAKALGVTLKGV